MTGWGSSDNVNGGNNNTNGPPDTTNSAGRNAKSGWSGIKMNVTYIVPLLLAICVAFAIVIW